MSTLIQLNIVNNSAAFQTFYVFQQPSIYTGGPQVYLNSVWNQGILPSSKGGSTATFLANLQYYAGVQQAGNQIPQVGQVSGYSSAIRAIGLTPAQGGTPTNNTTNMIIDPALGLTVPTATTGPQAGAFRIVTPTYDPVLTPYNAGSAIQSPAGTVTLSNFIVANPNQNIDCQPILKFYVQTGNYTPGTVINFTSSSLNAAVCDATTGFYVFNVSYNIDGTWTVIPYQQAQAMVFGVARRSALTNAITLGAETNIVKLAPNAQILNEAGTAVVSMGNAANFNEPVTISQLSNSAEIHENSEYQVGPVVGPYVGRLCIQKDVINNTATFA